MLRLWGLKLGNMASVQSSEIDTSSLRQVVYFLLNWNILKTAQSIKDGWSDCKEKYDFFQLFHSSDWYLPHTVENGSYKKKYFAQYLAK